MTVEPLFKVGTVVGFHGLKGQIKLRPATNNLDLLLPVSHVIIELPSGQQLSANVAGIELSGKLVILRLAGYNDRTSVEFLLRAQVFTERNELADLPADQWWVSDLIGLQVWTTEGKPVGKIVSIIDSGNQILEIESCDQGGRTILVPFVQALVPGVDIKARRVEVVDMPGLLEPQ